MYSRLRVFVLTKIGAGEIIYDLRKKIQQAQSDLEQIGDPEDIPELITSANLIRSNEYLSKANEKKTELLNSYELYFRELDGALKKIQAGLSSLKTPKKKRRKKQTKTKKKARKTIRRKKIQKQKSSRRKR